MTHGHYLEKHASQGVRQRDAADEAAEAGKQEVNTTRLGLGILAGLVLLGSAAPAAAAQAASTCATTVAPARQFAEPSPSSASRFWYGSEALAVLLPRGGSWRGMGPTQRYRNKLFWWRQAYDGATEPRPEER